MRSSQGCCGGMVQEKGSRECFSSWTVLCAQCTSALSSGFPLSQGNAEALDRWGGKTKHCLISYFLSNTSAKNYHNGIVYVKIIASQRWDVFETLCSSGSSTLMLSTCLCHTASTLMLTRDPNPNHAKWSVVYLLLVTFWVTLFTNRQTNVGQKITCANLWQK